MKLKEEEEEEIREEEETVVEYMDSDEEEKKKKKRKKMKEAVEVSKIEEVEMEEEEEAYSFPPMQEWTPAEKVVQSLTFLSFRPVELASSGPAHRGKPVRSTILGRFGRSVIIGPPPAELPWEKRHSSSTLMMVSPDQLRTHLFRQAERFNNLNSSPQRTVQTGRLPGQAMDKMLEYELQAAVTPWIGNLLIPDKSRLTAADTLRERGEKRQLSSTPIFLLLLQTMNVDSVGCKEMIEKRRRRVVFPAPPPDSSSVQMKNPKTIAGILQRRRTKEKLQGFDLQHSLILEQLQQQDRHRQLLRPQPPPHPPHPRPPATPSQIRPGILLQIPPNMHPQMSPMLFPRAIFIPQPVAQPPAASIRLLPPSSLTTPPPAPAVSVTSPLPAPQRLSVPPVSVLPVTLNATSTRSAGTLSENLVVPLPASPEQHVSTGSTLPSQDAVPSSSSSPSQPRPAPSPSSSVGKSQTGQGVGSVGGACTGLDGGGDGVIKEGRRPRKLTVEEAAEAKVTVCPYIP